MSQVGDAVGTDVRVTATIEKFDHSGDVPRLTETVTVDPDGRVTVTPAEEKGE